MFQETLTRPEDITQHLFRHLFWFGFVVCWMVELGIVISLVLRSYGDGRMRSLIWWWLVSRWFWLLGGGHKKKDFFLFLNKEEMNGGDEGAESAAQASPPQPLEWKFSQVFGERTAGEEVQEGKHLFIFIYLFIFKFWFLDLIGFGQIRVWFLGVGSKMDGGLLCRCHLDSWVCLFLFDYGVFWYFRLKQC